MSPFPEVNLLYGDHSPSETRFISSQVKHQKFSFNYLSKSLLKHLETYIKPIFKYISQW